MGSEVNAIENATYLSSLMGCLKKAIEDGFKTVVYVHKTNTISVRIETLHRLTVKDKVMWRKYCFVYNKYAQRVYPFGGSKECVLFLSRYEKKQ